MLIAILTDLHANREAVSACLADAERRGAQAYAFLGDLVGYGADPAWVVDTVASYVEHGAWAVVGNHDIATLREPDEHMNPAARAAIDWTRAQLSPSQRHFLSELPLTREHEDVLFVHASAAQPEEWEYILGPMEAMKSMHATRCRVTFCGHVHEPALYHLSSTGKIGVFTPTPEIAIPLASTRRWLAIPGAAGQPRDGNPAACYALYDDHSRELTYLRVPYDHETAARKIIDAGLPARLGQRLNEGT